MMMSPRRKRRYRCEPISFNVFAGQSHVRYRVFEMIHELGSRVNFANTADSNADIQSITSSRVSDKIINIEYESLKNLPRWSR